MKLLDKLRDAARLAGIVGVAAAGLALSYCSSSSTPPAQDVRHHEGSTGLDAAGPTPDAGPPDAAAKQDQGVKPDQRLWDVICE